MTYDVWIRLCAQPGLAGGCFGAKESLDGRPVASVATAGFFPLDLGFFGVVWVSGYFCQ